MLRSQNHNPFAGRRNRLAPAVALALVFSFVFSTGGASGLAAAAVAQRPGGDTQLSVFDQGRGYIVSGEWARAEKAFASYIESQPRGAHVDAAYYWLAYAMKRQDKLRQAEQVLQRLLQEHPRSEWADDARVMRVEVASQVGDGDALREAASSATNDAAKLVAVQGLYRQDPERAASLLLDVLKPGSGADNASKEAAVSMLAQAGAAHAAPLIAELARGESDPSLRRTAIRALGRVGGEGELGLLESLAQSEAENDIGDAAVFALAQHQSPRAVDFLVEHARTTKSRRALRRVVLSLGMRDAGAAEALTRVYDASADFDTKREVMASLFRRSERAGGEGARARLLEIARASGDAGLRREAVAWLGRRHDDRAVEDLSQLYDAASDEATRDAVIGALGRSFGRTAEQQELSRRKLSEIASNDASEALRNRATFWLGQRGGIHSSPQNEPPASPTGARAPGGTDAPQAGTRAPRASAPGAKSPGALPPPPGAKGPGAGVAPSRQSHEPRVVGGEPQSLSPRAKAPGALNLPAEAAAPAAAATRPQGSIDITGGDLSGRIEKGVAAGRARASGFWLAYSFDVRPGRAYKAAVAGQSEGEQSFDGPVPAGSPLETRNLAVFLHHDAGGRLDRVELFNLDRAQQYEGQQVYWLGRAGTPESLSYLRGVASGGGDGATFNKAIAAIALHNPAAGAGDGAQSILNAIARSHTSEAARLLAARWLRQLGGEGAPARNGSRP